MQRFRTIGSFTETITLIDTPTGGGQIYSKSLLVAAFDIYMSKNKIYRGGCIDTPIQLITEKNISHYLERVWIDDNRLMGTIEIVDTPMGDFLTDLIKGDIGITLALAAMATFKPTQIISRDLFEVRPTEDEFSTEVDTIVVSTVYATLKSNTTH